MWCEYVNYLIWLLTYTFDGNDDNTYYNTEVSLLGILLWSVLAIVVLIIVSWWWIPLRFLINIARKIRRSL